MSISSALAGAMSGLTASARAADVVSSNLANVLTPGYGTRQLELETYAYGRNGVGITGVTRLVDQGVVADRQHADSELAYADTRAQFLAAVERVIGTPDEASSLEGRLSAFEAALVSASSNPENTGSLQGAVLSAKDLTNALNRASSEVQKQRTEADGAIARAVENVNTLLSEIQELNGQLTRHPGADHHKASLLDQRQSLVDQLSEYIPVRQVPRDGGAIALFTDGGAILLDGSAAELGFSDTNVVAPHMTIDNGLLSGLTINGIPVAPSGNGSPIEGGRLAALFSVRDELGVDAQTQLDAISRDLVDRFQQAGLDPTLAPGDPGLLTDGGIAFAPANEVGLAGRISVNAAVDPSQGGDYAKLRDGLGATAPGLEGNGTLVANLASALSATQSLVSGDLGASSRSAAGHMSALTSRLAQDRLNVEQALTFATARQNELADLELQNGVDTDAEMQKLLLIEQAYAANARMIQTIDEMMQSILRI